MIKLGQLRKTKQQLEVGFDLDFVKKNMAFCVDPFFFSRVFALLAFVTT